MIRKRLLSQNDSHIDLCITEHYCFIETIMGDLASLKSHTFKLPELVRAIQRVAATDEENKAREVRKARWVALGNYIDACEPANIEASDAAIEEWRQLNVEFDPDDE